LCLFVDVGFFGILAGEIDGNPRWLLAIKKFLFQGKLSISFKRSFDLADQCSCLMAGLNLCSQVLPIGRFFQVAFGFGGQRRKDSFF